MRERWRFKLRVRIEALGLVAWHLGIKLDGNDVVTEVLRTSTGSTTSARTRPVVIGLFEGLEAAIQKTGCWYNWEGVLLLLKGST